MGVGALRVRHERGGAVGVCGAAVDVVLRGARGADGATGVIGRGGRTAVHLGVDAGAVAAEGEARCHAAAETEGQERPRMGEMVEFICWGVTERWDGSNRMQSGVVKRIEDAKKPDLPGARDLPWNVRRAQV